MRSLGSFLNIAIVAPLSMMWHCTSYFSNSVTEAKETNSCHVTLTVGMDVIYFKLAIIKRKGYFIVTISVSLLTIYLLVK